MIEFHAKLWYDRGMELHEGETLDELPGGIKILQAPALYRFTSDSVLLSRFASAKAQDVVADFCAGSGIVGLHFYALHAALVKHVTLVEMQPELFALSERSIALNGLTGFTAVCSRVQELGSAYNEAFSLILCNPPYERGGFENADYKKAVCRKELTLTLPELTKAAAKCLKFGGRLALCNRADRLAEVLYTMKGCGIEPKRVQLVRGRAGAKPYLLLCEGVKGGKPGTELLSDVVNTPCEGASG